MSLLPFFPLSEPLVKALKELLEANLAATIEELNANVTDGFEIDQIAQFLEYMPFAQTLEGGLPIVAIQRIDAVFQDDLQTNVDAEHQYAVIVAIENADHETLAKQLERTMSAVINTIQKDRTIELEGGHSVMRTQGGAWSVQFQRVDPGPLFGTLDPQASSEAPRSYMSWLSLVISSKRNEVLNAG